MSYASAGGRGPLEKRIGGRAQSRHAIGRSCASRDPSGVFLRVRRVARELRNHERTLPIVSHKEPTVPIANAANMDVTLDREGRAALGSAAGLGSELIARAHQAVAIHMYEMSHQSGHSSPGGTEHRRPVLRTDADVTEDEANRTAKG